MTEYSDGVQVITRILVEKKKMFDQPAELVDG
jgi:hypothetical protein